MATGTIKLDREVFASVCNLKFGRYVNSSGSETLWPAYYLAEIPVQPGFYINVLNSAGNEASYNKFIDASGNQVGNVIQNRSIPGFGQGYLVPDGAAALVVSMFVGQKQVLVDYYA